MQTFLGKTAAHIFGEHPIEELKDIAIVMPSQRGVLYLKKELAILGDRPFLSPSFFTIEEFALQMTDSTLIDPIQLLLEAFACFKQVDEQVNFDRFISWGQLMLKDFETLDMYLVDPYQIFSFLSEVKSIERWGKEYGEENPEKFITPHTTSYFKLFDHLLEVYIRLHATLNAKGFVYRGMAYRKLADYLAAGKALPKTFKKIYFVGFNALSKGEEEIIRLLIKNGMAQTLWDADAYYVDNTFHRAGTWLKKYSDSSTNEFLSRGPFQWKTSDLLDKPKRVEILGLANPSAQVFVAMDIIRKWQQEYGTEEQVALVLADESLLDQVMLYVGEFKERLNITMGYSLKKTQVFSLVNLWWDLQKQSVQGKFSVSTFKSVCSHGLIDLYIQQKSKVQKRDFKKDLNELYSKTDLYVGSDKISALASELPILKYLFATNFNSFVDILKYQETLLELILKSIPDQEWDEEAEAVKQALAVIESLLKSFEADDFVSIASGKVLLTQLLSQQKLTFVGAENRSLHVMGLLETRTLDFDRVIVLSMNEGSLPGTRKRESLIPLDIANMAHFSLPTFTQADAVASYHFYRLLQRPREVVLCYVQSSDKSGVKEMSRFIKQIKHDWKRKNPLIEIHEPWIEFSAHEADFERNDGSVEKSPVILDKIKGKLANSGLSTSALTMFSTCSLKYFYAQILGMRKEKQLEDELGADVFGTWVHKVLEIVDQEVVENYDGVYDRVNLAEVVSGLDGYLEKAMKSIQEKEGVFELEKGFNFVLKEVAKTLLESYYSKSDFSKNTKIIDLESTLTINLKILWGQEHLDVKVTGRIDRLDVLDNREIRIIDYKTGKVERSELKSGELGLRNSILSGELKPKILQLWLYKFLLASELVHVSEKNEQVLAGLSLQSHSIKPGIISFRNLKEGVLSDEEHDLWFESGPNWDQFLQESQDVIQGWVHQILDVNTKFEKTKEVSDCQYCDFKVICQREL